MDRILKILKKENGPRASSAPALELNTIIFKHVYWYMQQISGERLQDHWSSGFSSVFACHFKESFCPNQSVFRGATFCSLIYVGVINHYICLYVLLI